MKIPAWGYVVGILLMILGGLGIITDVQYMNSPKLIELQKETLDDLTKGIRYQKSDSSYAQIDISKATSVNRTDRRKLYDNVTTTLYHILDIPDYTLQWLVRFGYIGLLFSVLKICAGSFLMIKRSFSYVLALSVLMLSMGFNVIQFMVLASDYSLGLLSVTIGYLHVFFALIDLILLVVIIASDKSAYYLPKQNFKQASVQAK